MARRIRRTTHQIISQIFNSLDYSALGDIYCDEGGEAFWDDRRGPCQKTGLRLANKLLTRLKKGRRSLYVGAGVFELSLLVMETVELARGVEVFSLREQEVTLLNQACESLPFHFHATNARKASGQFDHIWMVSVLNDPECFPELSTLSYGRANPIMFNPRSFTRERKAVTTLVDECLQKLALPGLITTSVEEIPWMTDWCVTRRIPYVVEDKDYPTAIVGDPICLIRVGANR